MVKSPNSSGPLRRHRGSKLGLSSFTPPRPLRGTVQPRPLVQPMARDAVLALEVPVPSLSAESDLMIWRCRRRFTEDQQKEMVALGEYVQWNLQSYTQDKTITEKCAEIGITRDQFRKWVHDKKRVGRCQIDGPAGAAAAGSGSGSGSGGREDEAGPDAVN